MNKNELADKLEEILTHTEYDVFKEIILAISNALQAVENGVSEAEAKIKYNPSAKVEKRLKKAIRQVEREIDSNFEPAAKTEHDKQAEAVAAAAAVAGVKINRFRKNRRARRTAQEAAEHIKLTTTLALQKPVIKFATPYNIRFESPNAFYNRTVTNAIMDIKNGRASYNQAIKNAVTQLTRSGLRQPGMTKFSVLYQSGAKTQIAPAVRRAVMTELSHMAADMAFENAEILGTEYFEVDYHDGARPSHAEWQGGVYSYEELEEICGMGEPDGLLGVNCYHEIYPFNPETDTRQYSDEFLEEKLAESKVKTYYGDKGFTPYEAKQQQRKMESSMRHTRTVIDLCKETGVEPEVTNAFRDDYSKKRDNYNRFSKAMGQPTHYDRVYMDGRGRV